MATPDGGPAVHVQERMDLKLGYLAPAVGVVACTPSDTVDLAAPVRSIDCGANGTVTLVYADSSTQAFTVVAGDTIPSNDRQIKRVNATGTTLTGPQLTGALL